MVNPQEAQDFFADIESMVMDRNSSSARVTMLDGAMGQLPLEPSPFGPASTIVRNTYFPRVNRLYMDTNRGDTIEIELPTLHDSAPHDSRPVVYLDQKDWSLLANVLYDPKRVYAEHDRESATYLIELARAQKIILPMSFAHLGETSKWSDTERRYHLALTLTQLSRGWQMRYPTDVWHYEFDEAFAKRFRHQALAPLDTFTLEGGAIESQKNFQKLPLSSAGFPAGIEHVGRAMVCMMSYIDMVLASEASAMTPIPEWVDTFQLITDELAKVALNSDQKRRMLRHLFLKDLQLQVVNAAERFGVTEPELEKWVESHFITDVRAMNCLGLWNEIFQDKHLNSTTRWTANDLVDMMYLTCAAGYADYIAAEGSLTHYMNQAAKRLGRSIRAFPNISDLVVQMQNDGI